MSLPREIIKKLKGADPELSRFVKELEKENCRLLDKIAKLQVMNVTKDNEIKALKKAQPKFKINIITKGYESPVQPVPPTLPAAPQGNQPALPPDGKPLQITE